MKRTDIEQQIYEEFNTQKPELFDKILEQCPKMQPHNQKPTFWQQFRQVLFTRGFRYSFATFSVIAVFIFVLFGSNPTTPQVYSLLAIEANPSIILELDEEDNILSVTAENSDAASILGDMDLVGVNSNVAINAIIGSMLINGYISDLANSVLISVQCEDPTKEQELVEYYSQIIGELLSGSSINGSVITQRLSFSEDALELSEQLDISEAKAELILEIYEIDPRSSLEDLALLSINDLNLLLEAKNYTLDNIRHTGSASTLSILPQESVLNIALTHFGLDLINVLEYEIELEQEGGILRYEVELETASFDYELVLNAKDGSIITTSESDDPIDEDDLESILTASEVITLVAQELELNTVLMMDLEIELETENNIVFYSIAFEYLEEEYELEVDAITGTIYSNSMDESGYDYDD
jgi:uncharacterized membrane protein YkoI